MVDVKEVQLRKTDVPLKKNPYHLHNIENSMTQRLFSLKLYSRLLSFDLRIIDIMGFREEKGFQIFWMSLPDEVGFKL